MVKKSFEDLQLSLEGCVRLNPEKREGLRHLVELLGAAGAQVVTAARDKPFSIPDKYIDKNGSMIVPVDLVHELLIQDQSPVNRLVKCRLGAGGFGYLAQGRTFQLSQVGDALKPQHLDALARAQLALGLHLYPYLRPQFGWIDDMGDNMATERNLRAGTLVRLFWANFLSP